MRRDFREDVLHSPTYQMHILRKTDDISKNTTEKKHKTFLKREFRKK